MLETARTPFTDPLHETTVAGEERRPPPAVADDRTVGPRDPPAGSRDAAWRHVPDSLHNAPKRTLTCRPRRPHVDRTGARRAWTTARDVDDSRRTGAPWRVPPSTGSPAAPSGGRRRVPAAPSGVDTPESMDLWSYQYLSRVRAPTRPSRRAPAVRLTRKAAHGQGRTRQQGPRGEVRHREGLPVHPVGGRRGPGHHRGALRARPQGGRAQAVGPSRRPGRVHQPRGQPYVERLLRRPRSRPAASSPRSGSCSRR